MSPASRDEVQPGAEALAHDGGSVGVLSRPGFTTAANLRPVTAPLLVHRRTGDHVAGPNSMKALRTARPGVEARELRDSYHVATLDNDAPTIFNGTLEWIGQHARGQEQRQAQAEERA